MGELLSMVFFLFFAFFSLGDSNLLFLLTISDVFVHAILTRFYASRLVCDPPLTTPETLTEHQDDNHQPSLSRPSSSASTSTHSRAPALPSPPQPPTRAPPRPSHRS